MFDLEFENVFKSYGTRHVFESLTGVFRAGRVTGVVGPNGAGKTTLLRMAAGLQQPDRGTIVSHDPIYYGGFDSVPVGGRINGLRTALGLPTVPKAQNRSLRSLSRGELHRVGLTIALDLTRSVLLLDEPWTALEPAARETLNHTLQSSARNGAAVICSSHDLDEVRRVADDLMLLFNGEVHWWRAEELSSAGIQWDDIMRKLRGAN
ncbi:MAG TPA: ATP-binding cassette domain-containing protein [Thermoanaerobaculia bacterium]|jgi:ABC-type multidrug transport system ATPase subunit